VSIHGIIDQLAVGLGAKFMPKYFREGFESQTVSEHLENMKIDLLEIEKEGDYEILTDTLVGRLNPAFRLAQWLGEAYPAVIYHHGAAETPFDYGFKRIFPYKKEKISANLYLVRAPFHRSMKDFQQGICTLANIAAMLAVSVRLIEELVQANRQKGVEKILVAGTSLGGFITNLHHIYYNSADIYTPLLAGLAMHDAYLHSVYSKATCPRARENPEVIKEVLNFESMFANQDNGNVFPLLAVHDRLIRYEEQKASYGPLPVETINKGHTTGALASGRLREHILKHL